MLEPTRDCRCKDTRNVLAVERYRVGKAAWIDDGCGDNLLRMAMIDAHKHERARDIELFSQGQDPVEHGRVGVVWQVKAAGTADAWRPLAVVPPRPGSYTSHLVVGTNGSPHLRVLKLPDLELVHEVRLDGMKVTGLAAHPSGEALFVCDRVSWAIYVLPWPLEGMPRSGK